MTADPLLSTFPPPLARLILCGGGGLPGAWGPLISLADAESEAPLQWPWDPTEARVHPQTGRGDDSALLYPDRWRLPLAHWRPRLALVAAWILGWTDVRAAHVQRHNQSILLTFWTASADLVRGRTWGVYSGTSSTSANPDLPTLPTYLRDHDPAVALLLALYDVPEIRARVEAL